MALALTAIVPSSDRISGGVSVILLGSGFVATPTVTIGGVSATSVVFVSATKLTCVAPAGSAGAQDVVVTNPDTTTATLAGGFTYYTPAASDTSLVNDFGGVSHSVRKGSIAITQSASQEQGTFEVDDTTVVPFTRAKLGLGSLADADLLIHGSEQVTAQSRDDTDNIPTWTGTIVGSIAEFNRRLAWGTYVGVAADVVAQDLLLDTPGFTGAHIVSGLDAVTVTFPGITKDQAFQLLADLIGGYYYRDASYDVHLFLTETPDLTPDDLVAGSTTLQTNPALVFTADVSQLRNRVTGIGATTTLESDASLGDTSILVKTSNLFDNSAQIALLDGWQRITYTGTGLAYVPDPAAWQTQSAPTVAREWSGIAWAPALGLFAAVSPSPYSGVATSPDGIVWTDRTAAASTSWEDIAWSDSLGLFVAVAISGQVMTSTDGITWTSRTAADTAAWTGVAWSAALGLFAVVGSTAGGGGYQIMTSPNGVTWTARTAPSSKQWFKLDWSAALGLFAAGAEISGGAGVMTSPDGVTWTERTCSADCSNLKWSPSLSLFLVTGGRGSNTATTATSPDGLTWTAHSSVMPVSSAWSGLVWAAAGFFVAFCNNSGNEIAISYDGLTWLGYKAPTTATFRASAFAPTTGVIVAVGFTGTPTGVILSNTSVVIATLVGIPASGDGSIVVDVAAGQNVSLYAVRNDLSSQVTIAAIEGGPSDGVYEFKIDDSSFVTQASLDARCDADLDIYSDPSGLINVQYTTLDKKSRYGRPLHMHLPWKYVSADSLFDPSVFDAAVFDVGPADVPTAYLDGDFVINNVTIGNIDEAAGVPPLYTCTAASQRLTLTVEDLIRHVLVTQ